MNYGLMACAIVVLGSVDLAMGSEGTIRIGTASRDAQQVSLVVGKSTVVDVPVHRKQVEPSIQIGVEKEAAEPETQPRRAPHRTGLCDVIENTVVESGIVSRYQLPGTGVVLMDRGRLIWNIDPETGEMVGDPIFEAGPHPQLHGDYGDLCAVLTP